MSKLKISSGLASIVLLASIFSGWQTLLIVTVLLFAFCEVNDTIKNVAIRVITFYVGFTLVTVLWGIIYDGFDVVTDGIQNLVNILNCYLDKPIDITKLNLYLLTPLNYAFNIADGVVMLLLDIAKFGFVISVLLNRPGKDNFINKKINEYVSKAFMFINAYDAANNNTNQS